VIGAETVRPSLAAIGNLVRELGIGRDKAIVLSCGGFRPEESLDIAPEHFLQRAEDDLALGGTAALLNCVTNAKRAIRCQIDRVLLTLGYDPKTLKIRQKLELIGILGFVRPRLLQRVDDARNLLEHDYKMPRMEEVEPAVELAILFVEATNRGLNGFEGDFSIGNEEEYVQGGYRFANELSVGFYENPSKHFVIYGIRDQTAEEDSGKRIGKVVVDTSDPIYAYLIRISILGHTDWETKKTTAVREFLAALGV
jgi:hypothetical protein